jgi:hypothetical protein
MTHFTTLVVVPGEVPRDMVEQAVERQLAPFDESVTWFAVGSHWDWWVIGGRWRGMLIPMNGASSPIIGESGVFKNPAMFKNGVDGLRKEEINFEAIMAAQKADAEKWWAESETKPASDWSLMYMRKQDDTRESYVNVRIGFKTSAVVTKDGKWHEAGEIGWFGVGSDSKFEEEWQKEFDRHISEVDRQDWLVIVDCHI